MGKGITIKIPTGCRMRGVFQRQAGRAGRAPAARRVSGFFTLVLCLLLLAPQGALAAAPDGVRILVGKRAQVSGKRVTLADVAVVHGDPALAEMAGDIKLIAAPAPGKERRITGKRIAALIGSRRWVPKGAKVVVPETLTIKRAAQTVDRAVLEKLFADHVAAALEGKDYTIGNFSVRGAKPYPEGEMRLTVQRRGARRFKGNSTLAVLVEVDGRRCGKIALSGWIDRFERVVVARRELARNTVVTAGALRLERRNVADLPGGVLHGIGDAAGSLLRQKVRSGGVLSAGMLDEAPLVVKGSRVRLVVRAGGLSVSAVGIARTDGAMGRQIKVKNIASNKIVVGRVLDAATVEVLF